MCYSNEAKITVMAALWGMMGGGVVGYSFGMLAANVFGVDKVSSELIGYGAAWISASFFASGVSTHEHRRKQESAERLSHLPISAPPSYSP